MFEEPYRWTEAVGNRRAYVDAQVVRGSPVVAVSYRGGIILATFQRGIPKCYEIYDRIALGGLGHPADLETLRAAALDMAHVEGFTRSPSDVTVMRLMKYGLAPVVKRTYEEIFRAPLIIKVVLAQVGAQRDQDVFVTLDYDGMYEQSSDRAVLAATPEASAAMLGRLSRLGTGSVASLEEALPHALRAWAVGDSARQRDADSAEPTDEQLDAHLKATCEDRKPEIVLLDRTVPGASKYRHLKSSETDAMLVPWLGPQASAR